MELTNGDGHSGAVHQRRYKRRYFFGNGSGSAAAFFRHQRKAAAPLFFKSKKRQRFSAFFRVNFLPLPLLLINSFLDFFRFKFLHVIVWRTVITFFFTLLFLPHYFSLLEQTMLPTWPFVVVRRVLSYVVLLFLSQNSTNNVVW